MALDTREAGTTVDNESTTLGRFDQERTQQAAAAQFNALRCDSMSRMKLLKLLYIADRESVRETGRPITGDRFVAMDLGPVLSVTYDCIQEVGPSAAAWGECFGTERTRVVMRRDPGSRKLSQFEVETLEEVARRYEHLTPRQLSKLMHDFPEWLENEPPPGSRKSIPARDLLEAVGQEEDADSILEEAAAYARLDRLFPETICRQGRGGLFTSRVTRTSGWLSRTPR